METRQGKSVFSGVAIGKPVSYTHLDVYKRQPLSMAVDRRESAGQVQRMFRELLDMERLLSLPWKPWTRGQPGRRSFAII